MAANLDNVMTWEQACVQFEAVILPCVVATYEQDGQIDECARSEAWNNWTDGLREDGEISDWQYENWTHPACCG